MPHNTTTTTTIDSLHSFDINANVGFMLLSAKGHVGFMELSYYGIAVMYADLLFPLLFQAIQSWQLERFREMGPRLCFAIPKLFCTVTLQLAKKLRSTHTGKVLILTATVITVVAIIKCKCLVASQLWPMLVTASQIAFLLGMVLCSFLNASHVPATEQAHTPTQSDHPDSRLRREEQEAPTLFWSRAQTNCSEHCGNMYQQQIPNVYLPVTKNQLKPAKWLGMQESFSYVISCWPGPSYPASFCACSICGGSKHPGSSSCKASMDSVSSCLCDDSYYQCRTSCNTSCCSATACRPHCCSTPYECHLVCCFDNSYEKSQPGDVISNESDMPYQSQATAIGSPAICSYCCCCWCGFCCNECCYCSSSEAAMCGSEFVGIGDDSAQPKLRRDKKADPNKQNRNYSADIPTQRQKEFLWKWGQLATPATLKWDQNGSEVSEDVRLQLTMQYHRNLLALQYIVHVATATAMPSYTAPLGRGGSTPEHTASVKSPTCSRSQQHMQLLVHLQQRDNSADYQRQLLISCCVAGEQHLKTNNLCNIFSNNRKRHRRRCLRRRRQHRLRQQQAHKKKLNPCGDALGIHTKNEVLKSARMQQGCGLSAAQLSKCSKVNRALWKESKSKRFHQRIGNFQKTVAINILKAITGIISLTPPFLNSDAPHTTSATRTAVRLRVSLSASSRSTSILHAHLDAYPLVWAATTTISISPPTPPTSFAAAIPSTTRIIRRRVKSNLVWLFIGLVWFESPKLITCNIVTTSVNPVVQSSQQQHDSPEVSHHQESSTNRNQPDEVAVAMESQQQQLLLLPWTVSQMHQLSSGLRDFFTSKVNCSNTFKTNHEKRQAILQTQSKHHKVSVSPQADPNTINPIEKPPATPPQPPQNFVNSPAMQLTKTRSRRYYANQQEINYSNEFDKQEQVSTNLNDLARLESIKRQILSKLGLSHKPNVMHPLPKQFIWDTIYRADGIKSVNDFDFIVANREGGQRAHSSFHRRQGGQGRNRPHSNLVQPSTGIGSDNDNDRYDKPHRSHQRTENDHRLTHSMEHPARSAKNQISHAPYYHNRNNPEQNNMLNTYQEATTQYSRAYNNNTYHTDSKHKPHNANASVTETLDRFSNSRYDAHNPGYYSNSENQKPKNYFQSSKSTTYLFSNTTDGDVGRNSSQSNSYSGPKEADDALGGVGYAGYPSRRQENSFIDLEDHVKLSPSHSFRESGTAEHGYPLEPEMSHSDFHFADNDDFFGSTQEIITFAEKGTVFWHHRLVEFSKQRSVIPNQRLFIRNAEIHIRIDRVKPQSKSPVHVERRKRKLREPGNLNIWIFQLIDTNYTQKAFDKVTRLSAAYTVDTRQLGWQKLDITKSVQEWYSSSNQRTDKLRLLIDCSGCGKHYVLHLLEPPNEHATVQPRGKATKQKQARKHPMLPTDAVANGTRGDETFSLLWEHNGNKSYRYKYYNKVTTNINANNNIKHNLKRIQNENRAANGHQESNPNRPFIVLHTEAKRVRRVRRRAIDCLGASHGQCCKESFYVSFKQLGWDDWIIAPRGYFANYCRGDCTRPFRTPDTFQTFHAHFIEEYRKMGLLNGMQPCCAPIKFSSMSLIYYGDEGIIKRDLPKMVVDECGCP